MANTQYNVNAELRLKGAGASTRSVDRLAGRVTTLGNRLKGSSSASSALTRNLIAVGGTYLGIRALGSAFSRVASTAVSFNSDLQKTQIGLASIISAVDGMSFDDALVPAKEVFGQLRDDAITSAATTQEMFGIFQAIVGPIRKAGFAMQDVREITNATVSASSALNVDFQQAQRDISMMTRGAAGMDVKLFSMLRSTGAIAETTEQWNQSLSGAERVNKLRDALNKFQPAAEAYGKSFAGVTSSFKDITSQFLGLASGSAFSAITKSLRAFNTQMLDNRKQIEAALTVIGERVGATLQRIMDKATRAVVYVAQNWDAIVTKIEKVVRLIPKLGIAVGAATVGRSLAGGALTAGGGLIESMAPMIGKLGLSILPVVGIFAALAGLGVIIKDHWSQLVDLFHSAAPALGLVGTGLKEFVFALWGALAPVLKLLGAVALPVVLGALTLFAATLHGIAAILKGIIQFAQPAFDAISTLASDFVTIVIDAFKKLFGWVASLMGIKLPSSAAATIASAGPMSTEGGMSFDGGAGLMSVGGASPAMSSNMPVSKTINDFSNSKITVKQEFRQADPDRIAIQMVEDIHRQAEARIQSGFVPAFSR